MGEMIMGNTIELDQMVADLSEALAEELEERADLMVQASTLLALLKMPEQLEQLRRENESLRWRVGRIQAQVEKELLGEETLA